MRRIRGGESAEVIATDLGLTAARIRQIRRANGIHIVGLPLETRLMKRVQKTDGCWLWTGCLDQLGYGRIRIGGRSDRAHRVSYRLFVDPTVNLSAAILHSCDNPPCVNPGHLRAGTQADNALDRETRNRGKTRKLTPEQVLLIRTQLDRKTNLQLATEYGVHRSTIERIRKGVKWRWLRAS